MEREGGEREKVSKNELKREGEAEEKHATVNVYSI